MGISQFARSLRSIASNPHVDRTRAIARHLVWQGRKALSLFPFEQQISTSRIIASNPRCGVSALIYSQGLYNYDNMSLLRWLLRDGGLFVDVGANIGPYTLIASEQPAARILAFEPHPRTFRDLARNVELNRRANVSLFQLALSDCSGRALLTDDPASACNRLVPEARRGIEVSVRRADEIFEEIGARPRYAKVDVEGFEREVLAGFGRYLGELDLLLVEVNRLGSTRGAPIDELVDAHGLVGPFTCDFDARTIRGWRPPYDRIYLSRAFCAAAPALGLRVAAVHASTIAFAARVNV